MVGIETLASLARPFRSAFLDHETLTQQLRAWADAFPHVARLRSIGKSLEGRDLWVLTIGPEPDRVRPSAWIDGNMHASELSGSSVALAMAEDVLRLHLERDRAPHDLPPHVAATLREVVFHVMPRMCPDGAEAVLREGRYVRSNPRDRRPDVERPRWVARDVDGDGLALMMRVRDPGGEFVDCPDAPGLLVPRTLEDTGPFYKVYPEGFVEPFDGATIPDPYFLSDNDTDLNRNFPWSWAPEPEQEGAGAFPTSEPESRAVVEFVTVHPELFAWLNLHTFGGVYIRPLGHQPDKKMDPFDLAVFRQIEEWGERIGGYPMVSGFEEFLYSPDKPLHGDMSDFAYHQRGCISYVTELWDLFRVLGFARRKPFTDHYTHWTRDDMLALARFDREHNQGRIFRGWKPAKHPQLGDVEVGGIDIRVGLSNPPYERLAEVCTRQSAMFLRVAAMAPRIAIEDVRVRAIDAHTRRVDLTIANRGYLPTYVVRGSRELGLNEPLVVTASARGCALADPSDARRTIGHLEGWGQGKHAYMMTPLHQRSRGSAATRALSFVVSGEGTLDVKVGGCRTGYVEKHIEIG